METRASATVIDYRITFSDGQEVQHLVDVAAEEVPATAEWARLDYHQCAHCPLAAADGRNCPFAAALERPVQLLSRHLSYEEVDVVVRWRGREIRQHTTLQRVAGSLLGAVGGTCGCPHTRLLRPMAWFHWPFSDSDETLYRALSTYLLGQYLRRQHGQAPDWELDGLREVYRNLRQVNLGMARRLRAAAEKDSSLNGLTLLDLLAADTLYSLDRYDGELDRYFSAFLSPDEN